MKLFMSFDCLAKLLNVVLIIIATILLSPLFVMAGHVTFFEGYKEILEEQEVCIESPRDVHGASGVEFYFDDPVSGNLYINGKLAMSFMAIKNVGGNQEYKEGTNIYKIKIESPATLTRITGWNSTSFCGFLPSGPKNTLTVVKEGTGSGTVKSIILPEIDCGSECFREYPHDAKITLTATPGLGSAFIGWSGDCSLEGDVIMDDDKTCIATFGLAAEVSEGVLDHFKCYKAKGRSPKEEVSLDDQFETKDTQVRQPELVCNPVDKNGEGINNLDTHLTCYKIKDVRGQSRFKKREVLIENQLDRQTLKVLSPDVLCVPSSKIDLDP